MKKLFPMILILMLLGACGQVRTVPLTTTSPYRQSHLTPFLGPTETTFQLPSLTPQSSPSVKAPLIPITSTTAAAVLPNFDHIVLIVLENTDYSVALDSSSMPHLAELAGKNSLLSNYFAVSHPSLPNYLALMSGSTQGVTSDCTNCFVSAQNLAGELDQAGKTWKAYLESMPSPCFLGEASRYAQQHNPLIYFDSVRLDTSICKTDIVPLTQLWPDLTANQFPDFAFIMPDMCNSGHDCGATTADTWIDEVISKLQGSSALGDNSLIVITFDEAKSSDTSSCCGAGKGGGHIATVLISPKAKSSFQDETPYSHYSLLKTILMAWHLPLLGNTEDDSIQPIMAPWAGP